MPNSKREPLSCWYRKHRKKEGKIHELPLKLVQKSHLHTLILQQPIIPYSCLKWNYYHPEMPKPRIGGDKSPLKLRRVNCK